jgi:hypothetical protein
MSANDTDDHVDPTEEVGPEASETTGGGAELPPGAHDAPPEESQVTFDDEMSEAFVVEASPLVPHPVDGLPVPTNEMKNSLALAPRFSIDNVVCIEDERSFVELFADELPPKSTWKEPMVVFDRPRFMADGTDRSRLSFDPARVVRRWGHRFVHLTHDEWDALQERLVGEFGDAFATAAGATTFATADDGSPPWVAVRPVRERCHHYKRQAFANDDVPNKNDFGHTIVFRNCLVRRSVGGALMSLHNQAVFACEYRDPPHQESVTRHLDEKDAERLRAVVVEVPLFNIQDPPPHAGVYRTGEKR